MYLLYTASNLYYKKKYTDMLNKKITGKCVSGCKKVLYSADSSNGKTFISPVSPSTKSVA